MFDTKVEEDRMGWEIKMRMKGARTI